MYSCPACGSDEVAGQAACKCGAELTLLQHLDALADAWFNRALSALSENQPGQALEWLSACCAARPTDSQARRAQARVWAQLGRWGEARDALDRAEVLDPDSHDLQEIRQALQECQTKAVKRSRKPFRQAKKKRPAKTIKSAGH